LNLANTTGKNKITSLYDLIGSSIQMQGTSNGKQVNVIYDCPLADSASTRDLFPALYDKTTTNQDPQILGRININTCNQAVLNCIANLNVTADNPTATPYLLDTDVLMITSTRPQYNSTQPPDPIFNTPAWLITEAGISPAMMKRLDKYITTTTQVYRFQSLGFFEEGGLAVRFEAVVDANQGFPRILYQRDITELGKGYQTQFQQ